MLAQRLLKGDPAKIMQWDAETLPGPVVSGGETSSDEGEPIPQHALHVQYTKATEADISRPYHVPIAAEDSKAINDARLRSSQFNQQRRDYAVKEQRPIPGVVPVEEARTEDMQSYKCQVCPTSMRTVNALQVHCFVEHNIETDSSTNIQGDLSAGKCSREKENTQKRIAEESVVKEDHGRQRIEDT
jgi:hypothetical protein